MSNPFGMSQDDAMKRTWARVTYKGSLVCGPITSIQDAYDAVLVIVWKDNDYIVWKDRFAIEYQTFSNEQQAAKYVADFISAHHTS